MRLLAQSDSQVMEIVKDPGFAQWVVYLLVVVIGIEKIGGGLMRFMGVSLPVKRDISGTLTTVPERRHAEQGEVDELADELQNLREENQAQHAAASLAGTQRVTALSEVIDTRTNEIEDKLAASVKELMERMDTGFQRVSDQLAGIAIQSARHDAVLPDLRDRITALTERYNKSLPDVHKRIDELTRALAERK
jgi:hypothetical protein